MEFTRVRWGQFFQGAFFHDQRFMWWIAIDHYGRINIIDILGISEFEDDYDDNFYQAFSCQEFITMVCERLSRHINHFQIVGTHHQQRIRFLTWIRSRLGDQTWRMRYAAILSWGLANAYVPYSEQFPRRIFGPTNIQQGLNTECIFCNRRLHRCWNCALPICIHRQCVAFGHRNSRCPLIRHRLTDENVRCRPQQVQNANAAIGVHEDYPYTQYYVMTLLHGINEDVQRARVGPREFNNFRHLAVGIRQCGINWDITSSFTVVGTLFYHLGIAYNDVVNELLPSLLSAIRSIDQFDVIMGQFRALSLHLTDFRLRFANMRDHICRRREELRF